MSKPLLRTLGGAAVWPPPIWLITLQPIRRYGFDGAILFSDILMIPWALGQGLAYREGEGPLLPPLRDAAALRALRPDRVRAAIQPILETVRLVRSGLLEEGFSTCSLIGFAGSPFTVACYMVEGGGSRDFAATRHLAYAQPDVFDELIALLVDATIIYLSAQIEAGAEVVMLFDTWAGILPPAEFRRLVIEPTAAIVSALRQRFPTVPIIGFPRLAGMMVGDYAIATRIDGIGLDTSAELGLAAKALPPRIAMQGNLDPLALVAGGRALHAAAAGILETMKGRPFIFNLGHGIVPQTPPQHVAALVEQVRGVGG